MSKPANGWGELFSADNWLKVLVLTGGVGLHAVNIFISGTLLPSAVKDIGGLDLFAWNTTLFVIASILAAVYASVRPFSIGPRGSYVVATVTFGLGSLICALAPNMETMLVGRFTQGFGAGLLVALSYAMIRLVFAPALWSRAIGLTSAVWGIATVLGPAIGGIFAEYGAWRLAFWVLLPLAVGLGLIARAVVPVDTQHRSITRTPFAQIVLLVTAVVLISLGSTYVTENITLTIGMLIAAIVCMAVLVRIEIRSENRLLPSGSFDLGNPLCALYATMVLLSLGMTSDIFAPLFLQVLHGQSPIIAGYLTAAIALGWTVASMFSSGWGAVGAGRAIALGPAILGVCMLILGVTIAQDNVVGERLVLLPIAMALFGMGFGMGLGWPHLLTRVMQFAPPGEHDRASASITMVQLFANALGASIAGMVVNGAGLLQPGGIEGAVSASRWLFLSFALGPLLALPAAWAASRIRAR